MELFTTGGGRERRNSYIKNEDSGKKNKLVKQNII
jgi:hypothetical protein